MVGFSRLTPILGSVKVALLGDYFEIEQRLTEMFSPLLKRCMYVTHKPHKVLENRASNDQNRNVEELRVDALHRLPGAPRS